MATTNKLLPKDGSEVAIAYNNTTATIIQNLSTDIILWSTTTGGDAWHELSSKSLIRVDFDVIFKTRDKTSRIICVTQ